MSGRYLVTGANGCIGAWVVHELVEEGADVVAFDLGDDPYRMRMLLTPAQLDEVRRVRGDVTDLSFLEDTLERHEIEHVIHLAALQVPFCRADPPLGARVNVVGTVNVLEAVRRRADGGRFPLVYASSAAVYGEEAQAPADVPELTGPPSTIYGVFKRSNEGAAGVYWADAGVASIGLRPHTVYGPGRDQGATSSPTAAMLSAAAGRPFHIPYGGSAQMQYAQDVARAFVSASKLERYEGASVHNLAGHVAHMREVVAAIEEAVPAAAGTITFEDHSLPFLSQVDTASFVELFGEATDRPLREGIRETVERFQRLLEEGIICADGDVSTRA